MIILMNIEDIYEKFVNKDITIEVLFGKFEDYGGCYILDQKILDNIKNLLKKLSFKKIDISTIKYYYRCDILVVDNHNISCINEKQLYYKIYNNLLLYIYIENKIENEEIPILKNYDKIEDYSKYESFCKDKITVFISDHIRICKKNFINKNNFIEFKNLIDIIAKEIS